MPDVHQQSQRFALPLAAYSSRCIGALLLGQVLLMIGGLCCCGLSLLAQTSDSTTTGQRNESWTATTDLKANHVNPTRVIESHSQNGNRMLDKQSVQVFGSGGQFEPYQDIEKETLQVDATTVRTTTRAFGRDSDGRKTLVQVIEEEKQALPSGDSKSVRITSNPDLSGRLQIVQREIVETKKTGVGVEETDTTVMLPSINGGLAPAFKSHELRQRGANDSVESQKTTLLPDGAGNFQVVETRQSNTRQEANERSTEERISRLDASGKLVEVSHVVSKESENTPGEQRNTVETYSVDVPGGTPDGSLHLVERATTTRRSSATGEQITEKQVEKPNPGDPDSGLRLTTVINDIVQPGPSGSQATRTIRTRDGSGNFGVVSVETSKSDRVLTIQVHQTPSEQPK